MTDNPYDKLSPAHIEALLEPVTDPELGIGIVDLGLVYDIRVDAGAVEVDMTFTSYGCPAGDYLYQEVTNVLSSAEGVDSVKVNVVWDPPWDPGRVNPEVRFALGLL